MDDPAVESIGMLISDVARLYWRRLEARFTAEGLDFTASEARGLIKIGRAHV